MNNISKKWYQKKWYAIPLGFASLFLIIGIVQAGSPASTAQPETQTQTQVKSESVVTPTTTPTQTTKTYQPIVAPAPILPPTTNPAKETPNYYINSSGNKIQSPTKYDSAPSGASARCRDGTYSFSQHRSGTCSHHGGVAEWY